MSDLIKPSRRLFLGAVASLISAPAIVRVSSLMPLRGASLFAPFEVYTATFEWDVAGIVECHDVFTIRQCNVIVRGPFEWAGI